MKKLLKLMIVICFSLLFAIYIYEKLDYQFHSVEIDNVFFNDISVYEHQYIGYIEINRLNIKREIVLGINSENLKEHVTLSNESKNLSSDHIVLAGHGIKNIFGNLYKIKIGDSIKITSFNEITEYFVVEKVIVSKYNTKIIQEGELVLITCTMDDKRLIIKAKKIRH